MAIRVPTALYKKIHASIPIPCVDIVVLNNEGQVLLCHRTNKPAEGIWWFPGGGVLKGETMKEAVLRKVKEETGLTVKIIKKLGNDETMFPDGPFGGPTHTINTVFLAVAKKGGVIQVDQQSDEVKWFTKLPKNSPAYIKKFYKLALT
jgi:colanic acid biosynthesis protein WcaH